jgi:beta-galactosidase
MESKSFKNRKSKFHLTKIKTLYTSGTSIDKLGVTVIKSTPSEEGYEPIMAIDGDVSTMLHSKWTGEVPKFPHEIQFKFKQPVKLRSLIFTPRQDNNRNGWIKDFEIYKSADGVDWGSPITRGSFPNDANPKTVNFNAPITTQFLRIVVLSSHSTEPYASLAELEFV